MKKFFSVILIFMFGLNSLTAQTMNVSGVVTGADDGQPLPGVSVVVLGTTQGTVTNADGTYTISASADAYLRFTFMGMSTQSIAVGGRQVIDVVLQLDAHAIDELVVTALGISRERRALGYAVQVVEGEELARVRTHNVLNSLSGRVAGAQITSSSGQLGGGARINIRGNTSLTGNNQPLFVVDGVPISNSDYSSVGGAGAGSGYNRGNMASDVSPDDIESITLLKGASATALYGSRAANGVVLITTKKGTMGASNLGVSVNSSVTFEQVGIMPVYQKLYGGGSNINALGSATINGQTYNVPDYRDDWSWGPKYDPSLMHLPWNAFDAWDTDNYMKVKPWVYPENDYTTFFNTGIAFNNNVSVSGGGENHSFRLSYSNLDQSGIYENSKLKRNNISFSGTAKMHRLLEGFINVSYVNLKMTNSTQVGYGDNNTGRNIFQWSHTQVDYEELRAYENPDGTQRAWNRGAWNSPGAYYIDNPYWTLYKNYDYNVRDRVFGNTGLHINLADGLKLTGRVGVDTWMYKVEERTAHHSNAQTRYQLIERRQVDTTLDLFLTYNNRFNDNQLGFSAMAGVSSNNNHYQLAGGQSRNGLVVPGIFNLGNSVADPSVYDTKNRRRLNSVFGNVTLDWDMLVYLDITARNDWSSTLPEGNNSYFYPSFNLSFVASQLEALQNVSWLSFAKIRAGYAMVGNDTGAYQLQNYFTFQTPFGTNTRFDMSRTLENPLLKPEKTTSWEIGAEAYFFTNRLGIDIAYYQKSTVDQIIAAPISRPTGYSSRRINTGELQNNGLELTLSGAPVRNGRDGFNWDVQFNLTTLNSKVVSIAPEVTWVSLGANGFSVNSGGYEGDIYPIIYGTNFVFGPGGEKLINPANGLYRISEDPEPLGNVTPKFTAGLSNSFSWKGLDLNILFDMQRGGNIYYLTYAFGMYSGMLEESAAPTNVPGQTGDIRETGIILDGVYGNANGQYTDATGNVVTTPVASEVPAANRSAGGGFGGQHYSLAALNVFKSDYIKLREVSIGYTLPSRMTGPFSDVRISAFGRNLATFGRDNQHFDPEYIQMAGGNAQGLEGGYAPTTRTFGFSIGFNF